MASNLALAFQLFAIAFSFLGLATLYFVIKSNERRENHGRKTSLLSSILIAIRLRSLAGEHADEESLVIAASPVISDYGAFDAASGTTTNSTTSPRSIANTTTTSFDSAEEELRMESTDLLTIPGASNHGKFFDARKRVTMTSSDKAWASEPVVPHRRSSAILVDELMAAELRKEPTPSTTNGTPPLRTLTSEGLSITSTSRGAIGQLHAGRPKSEAQRALEINRFRLDHQLPSERADEAYCVPTFKGIVSLFKLWMQSTVS